VQHVNHKVAIVTDCDAIPSLRRTLGPHAVITMADDQGGTLDVKLLELLCFKRTRYKDKVGRALKMENDGSHGKGCRFTLFPNTLSTIVEC